MKGIAALLLVFAIATQAAAADLKVCADPNNLPFSNDKGQGFENELAALIAQELGREVSYVWDAPRPGFAGDVSRTNVCDIWPGIATGVGWVATTRPYYRASYVFVTRRSLSPVIVSFDDPRLRTLKLSVQMVGNDAIDTPPAHALARRGILGNVRGFVLHGDYRHPNPTAAIVDDVAKGKIDVAVLWGPLAGYYAARQGQLAVYPVPERDGPLPMRFDISVGVAKADRELKDRIDAILERRRTDIDAILHAYHVPRVSEGTQARTASGP